MKRKNFTLMELLAVIGIIAILQAMLLPAVLVVQAKARVSAAKQEMNAISLALSAFEQEYGRYPTKDSADEVKTDGSDLFYGVDNNWKVHMEGDAVNNYVKGYYTFFDVLSYANHNSANDDPTAFVKSQNSRKKTFLDVDGNYFGPETSCGIRDPWENTYVVAIDANGDGKITIPGALTKTGSDLTVHKSICIISVGADDTNKDDLIYSWD